MSRTTGSHKLARQTGRTAFYAKVDVSVEPGVAGVSTSSDAFIWLREAYGPNAAEGPGLDEFRSAAVTGARFALAHLTNARPDLTVLVTTIHFMTTDTDASCVAYAACRAVWDAVDDPGAAMLTFDQRTILFNGKPFSELAW